MLFLEETVKTNEPKKKGSKGMKIIADKYELKEEQYKFEQLKIIK